MKISKGKPFNQFHSSLHVNISSNIVGFKFSTDVYKQKEFAIVKVGPQRQKQN